MRANPNGDLIRVDGYGVVELVKLKISIEVWVYHNTKLYHPGAYLKLTRNFSAWSGTMDLDLDFDTGNLPVKIGPMIISSNDLLGIEIGPPRMRRSTPESGAEYSAQSFEPLMVWLVIRPYGLDGLSRLWQLEYKEGYLLANHRKILHFLEEPQHCFFSNARRGDVTQFFRLWEGNSKIEAADGSCTGMIGFAAVPDKWRAVRIAIQNMERRGINRRMAGFFVTNWQTTPILKLRTGTRLDELYPAAIRHLTTFCREKVNHVHQIMVYNRLGLYAESLGILTTALRKVRWDGRLSEQWIGAEYLIFAVADYYKMTGNQLFIEKYWPVLKRVGSWLCYQSGLLSTGSQIKPPQNAGPDKLERLLWLCGSFQSIAELGMALNKNREVQVFKSFFLMVWTKLLDGLTATGREGILSGTEFGFDTGAEIAVRSLQVSFPLQLTGRGTPWVLNLLRRLQVYHLLRGGFVSPQDFQGASLELTARLGQALIREGLDYHDILEFLLKAAEPAFSWPDRIHPYSREGIGEEGHDPKVLYQMLLLVRNLFFNEEQDNLHLLPGLFISRFWQNPNLELIDWPTYFGTVSVQVRTIGGVSRINFKPVFRRRPQKILLTFHGEYRLLYTDTNIQWNGKTLILEPDFRVLRVSNNACLDNTFGHTL